MKFNLTLASVAVALTLPALSAHAAKVTLEEVKAMMANNAAGEVHYVGERAPTALNKAADKAVQPVGLLVNKHGTSVTYGDHSARYSCGKNAGYGGGNAKNNVALNCELNKEQNPHAAAWIPKNPTQIRVEWLDADTVKYEEWPNMAAKAGQTQHKGAHWTATLKKTAN